MNPFKSTPPAPRLVAEQGSVRERVAFARTPRWGLLSGALACALAALAYAPAAQADPCPNEALRAEQHSTYLPDCRAYEMVSPPDKNGANVMTDTGRTRVADDGSAAAFPSLGVFADALGTGNATEYMALRGAGGWSTHAITPPQEPMTFIQNAGAIDPTYWGDFSPDLSRAVFQAFSPLPGTPETVSALSNLYLRTDLRSPGSGSYQLQSDCLAPPQGPCGSPLPSLGYFSYLPHVVGASTDLTRLLFESLYPLTNDAPTSTASPKLYESVDGALRYVAQIPAGSATSCAGAACQPAPRSIAGQNGASVFSHYTPHVISANGSRLFFTVPVQDNDNAADLGLSGEGDLYLRDDHGTETTADDTTTLINASERAAPDSHKPARYWDAAADGSRAFFTSTQALTEDAPVSSTNKLYMWSLAPDAQGHHLTYLSADNQPADPLREVEGVLGTAADGSYVYFLQIGQIVAGQEPLGNGFGIYVWHQGDGVKYLGQVHNLEDVTADIVGADHILKAHGQPGAVVTPDGSKLLISLRQPPVPNSGYDHGICPGDSGGTDAGCRELYLYDATTDSAPICISCRPGGGPATGTTFFATKKTTGVDSPPTGNAVDTTHLDRPLADNGHLVFFTSEAGLLPADTNGVADAYEWEAPGAGSCTEAAPAYSPANGGCLYLLSSGTDPNPSYFVEATPDGSGAFIETFAALSGYDVDQANDLYDVRVQGGFPEPPPAPEICAGETCRPAAAQPPSALPPASNTLLGPPDPKRPPPCKRGEVRKHGHCVGKRHKRHSKRTGSDRGGNR